MRALLFCLQIRAKTWMPKKGEMLLRRKIGFRKPVIAAMVVVLIITAFYQGLVVRRYTVETDKLRSGESVRIVLIADLHSHIYGNSQNDLIDLIKKQKPDLIALAGDIADDYEPILGTELLLSGIKGIAPVYYVSGNHECWSGDVRTIKETIRSHGVTVLECNYEKVTVGGATITIAGVEDPDIMFYEDRDYDWLGGMHSSFSELGNEDGLKILLAHRPEQIVNYSKFSFDLVLSGHAHGGQVRIPFLLNGLLAPNQGWFPRYAGGLYRHDTLTHIVSRGVSYNPRLPRIFNPPEVVAIDIRGTGN